MDQGLVLTAVMDSATKETLVQTIWGVDLTEDTDNKLAAYFQYCHEEELDITDEALFFIGLLKTHPDVSKASVKAMVEEMQQAWSSSRSLPTALYNNSWRQQPLALERARQILTLPTFKVEDIAIARAVRIMLGIDMATRSTEIVGNSMIIWDDTKSMRDVVEQSLPGLRQSVPTRRSFSSAATSAVTLFDKKKLRARHLRDYAKIEVVWTKHLPDHLELDGKTLRIFQLASLLEMSAAVVDRSETDLAECLKQ